jgi:hypothetical protein
VEPEVLGAGRQSQRFMIAALVTLRCPRTDQNQLSKCTEKTAGHAVACRVEPGPGGKGGLSQRGRGWCWVSVQPEQDECDRRQLGLVGLWFTAVAPLSSTRCCSRWPGRGCTDDASLGPNAADRIDGADADEAAARVRSGP